MPRVSKRQQVINTYAALLVLLDELAAIPSAPCGPCGRTTEHERCSKCGTCEPSRGPATTVSVNYRSHAVYGCGACGAKASYHRMPVYTWHPKLPFPAEFGRDLAAKIRERGWAPSPKQEELARRLHAEAQKPRIPLTTGKRPAIEWITPRNKKGWRAIIALTERSFCLLPSANNALDDVRINYREATKPNQQIARETLALVRAEAMRQIGEVTGYDMLTTTAEISDAMRVVVPTGRGKARRGDKIVYAVLEALLDTHSWLLRERRVIENACPKAHDDCAACLELAIACREHAAVAASSA